MAEFRRKRRKVCQLCAGKELDYKNADDLRKYINEKGKILPRRVTGTCAKHQRIVATQIKRARMMAILPLLNSFDYSRLFFYYYLYWHNVQNVV